MATRAGAESAMDTVKFGFLIVAGFRIVVYGSAALAGGLQAIQVGAIASVVVVIALVEIAVPLFAAWRLHLYRGAFVVPIATALHVLGVLAALNIVGIAIGIIFTGVFIAGIRGAWAVKRGTAFADDHYATFS